MLVFHTMLFLMRIMFRQNKMKISFSTLIKVYEVYKVNAHAINDQEGVNTDSLSHEDYLNAPGETVSSKFEKVGSYGAAYLHFAREKL